MPKVRGNGAQRWASRTAAATPDYQAGVANPRQSWQAATVAAAPAHKAAMMDALAQDRFSKGVQKAGDAKWQRGASGKGAERFGAGAAAGVDDYASGVQKYIQVIESTTLPPRGPKGDPRNIQRVAVLAAALRKAKTGFALLPLLIGCMAASGVILLIVALSGPWTVKQPSGGDGFRNASVKARQHGEARRVAGVCLFGGLVALGCMGAAIDVISYSATAPGAAGAAATVSAGDSFAVRNTSFQNVPVLLQHWAKNQVAGFHQVIHPSGHDQVRDLRMRISAATPLPNLCWGYSEPCQPQEAFSVTIAGSAVAGQVEIGHLMMYYPDVPGIAARLVDLSTLDSRFVEYVTVEDTTTATVAGTYSGARALNAASDLLIANTDYAIIGAQLGALCSCLTVRGTDTGNVRVPIPGMNGRPDLTSNWFPWLSQEYGLPLVPVINSANKAAIFIENVQDQALTAVPFSLLLARLSMA